MVDAPASGAGILTGVEVRVFSWAPKIVLCDSTLYVCPGGGIGRRASFRCWYPHGCGSSSLLLGTKISTPCNFDCKGFLLVHYLCIKGFRQPEIFAKCCLACKNLSSPSLATQVYLAKMDSDLRRNDGCEHFHQCSSSGGMLESDAGLKSRYLCFLA